MKITAKRLMEFVFDSNIFIISFVLISIFHIMTVAKQNSISFNVVLKLQNEFTSYFSLYRIIQILRILFDKVPTIQATSI